MRNKFLSAIISAIILISIFSFNSFAAQPGDVDNDGKITAADARYVLRQSVGLENISETDFFTADMDSDGKITAADARIILRISVGLEKVQAQNEYELIRSGRFHLTGSAYMFEQPIPMNTDFIISGNTANMILEADGSEITVLIQDEHVYFIYDEKKAVLDIADVLSFIPESSRISFIDGSFMDTSYYPSFENLILIGTEEYNSKECSVYYVPTDEEVVIYMSGNNIERIIVYGSGSVILGDIAVEKISSEIPDIRTDVPSSYKKYKGLTGAMSFFELFKK